MRRVEEFALRKGLVIHRPLGSGVHGSVFAAESHLEGGQVALKGFEHERWFRQERDVYLRLLDRGIFEVCGCHIPELLDFDDRLWVIEMTIVTRPFVPDFAGAYLDHAPAFSDEVLADWHAEKREQFETRGSDVLRILAALQMQGIHMIDVNPGNISFGD